MPDDRDVAEDNRVAAVRKLAYDESVRWQDLQVQELLSLQTRAGIVLAAATAATAFVAGAALDRIADLPSLAAEPLVVVAAGLYVLVGGLSVGAAWPREWHFTDDAEVILQRYGSRTISETHHLLAEFNSKHAKDHRKRLRVIRWLVQLAAGSLIVEIALWLVFLLWRT